MLSFPGIDVVSTIGLGFWTASEFAPFGGAGSFGHSGAGGSVGFADPDHSIAGGYVMNRMMQGLAGDPRSTGLIQASYRGGRPPPDLRIAAATRARTVGSSSLPTTPASIAATSAAARAGGPVRSASSVPSGTPANA